MTTAPEPCLDLIDGRCSSPVACSGWGYCRERNLDPGVDPTDSATIAMFRKLAEAAKAKAV
jgi:hypothetical protein